MGRILAVVRDELRDTWRRPSRLGALFDKKRLRHHLLSMYLRLRYGDSWSESEKQFAKRNYRSYADYIAHQQSKMQYGLIDITDHHVRYREILRGRLQAQQISWAGKRVLCLGARSGAEVRSFLDLGCFAVGIDLLPGKENPFVLYGDFHNLQFAPGSVDVVFSNALDHAFDAHKILKECARVLDAEGILVLEVMRGSAEGVEPLFFESFGWRTTNDLIPLVEKEGFRFLTRYPFSDYTYPGEQLFFERLEQGSAV